MLPEREAELWKFTSPQPQATEQHFFSKQTEALLTLCNKVSMIHYIFLFFCRKKMSFAEEE